MATVIARAAESPLAQEWDYAPGKATDALLLANKREVAHAPATAGLADAALEAVVDGDDSPARRSRKR